MKHCKWIQLSGDEKIKVLSVICAFLGGIIIGFLMAPIKKGIKCGCNNGNNNGNNNSCDTEHNWEMEE